MSFFNDFEVFPTKPPRFVPEIYPFLGFNSPLEYLPKSAILITTHCVHTKCSLKNPLLGFSPLQHFSKGKFHRINFATSSSRTLAGFDYPLSVRHFPFPQALFHAWSAHGVTLTELFALLKALTFSSSLLPCPLFFNPPANSQRNLEELKTKASKLCSLSKAVLSVKGIKFYQKPGALSGLSPLRYSIRKVIPASRDLLLCSYLKGRPKVTIKNPPWSFNSPDLAWFSFKDHAPLLVFSASS